MDQRRIGDRTVGAIGLGAMPMSVRERNDEAEGVRTIRAAVDAGVTLIDTADAYSPDQATFGHNEELIARALKECGPEAADVLVATKGGHTRRGTEWELDGRPEYLRAACEASLRRLGVEQIGLYQHHRPDPAVDYAETVGGLKGLLEDGLIKYAGISNADPGQIRVAHEILGDALVSVQNQYSPRFRSSQPELDLAPSWASPSSRGARWAGWRGRTASAQASRRSRRWGPSTACPHSGWLWPGSWPRPRW